MIKNTVPWIYVIKDYEKELRKTNQVEFTFEKSNKKADKLETSGKIMITHLISG